MVKKVKAITKTRNLKNTKYFMVFFVVSTFRDFVIRDLFLFRFIRLEFRYSDLEFDMHKE